MGIDFVSLEEEVDTSGPVGCRRGSVRFKGRERRAPGPLKMESGNQSRS